MIWVALLLGVVLGMLFDRAFEWILWTPLATVDKLKEENDALKIEVATLRAQLEALEQYTPTEKAF